MKTILTLTMEVRCRKTSAGKSPKMTSRAKSTAPRTTCVFVCFRELEDGKQVLMTKYCIKKRKINANHT